MTVTLKPIARASRAVSLATYGTYAAAVGSYTSAVAAGEDGNDNDCNRMTSNGAAEFAGSTGSAITMLDTGMLPELRNEISNVIGWHSPGAGLAGLGQGVMVSTPREDFTMLPTPGVGFSTGTESQACETAEAEPPPGLTCAVTSAQLPNLSATSAEVTPVALPCIRNTPAAPAAIVGSPAPSRPVNTSSITLGKAPGSQPNDAISTVAGDGGRVKETVAGLAPVRQVTLRSAVVAPAGHENRPLVASILSNS